MSATRKIVKCSVKVYAQSRMRARTNARNVFIWLVRMRSWVNTHTHTKHTKCTVYMASRVHGGLICARNGKSQNGFTCLHADTEPKCGGFRIIILGEIAARYSWVRVRARERECRVLMVRVHKHTHTRIPYPVYSKCIYSYKNVRPIKCIALESESAWVVIADVFIWWLTFRNSHQPDSVSGQCISSCDIDFSSFNIHVFPRITPFVMVPILLALPSSLCWNKQTEVLIVMIGATDRVERSDGRTDGRDGRTDRFDPDSDSCEIELSPGRTWKMSVPHLHGVMKNGNSAIHAVVAWESGRNE